MNRFVFSDLEIKCSGLESTLSSKDREIQTYKTSSTTSSNGVNGSSDRDANKIIALEQRIKDLQGELDCQRHNAEATKTNMEKKLKETVKEIFKRATRWLCVIIIH